MMPAIIMAGRTGAAFAAQLGTMTVNEEIDALTTLGLSPMEFLVVPRMLALVLMMPLLTLYADLLGILGGALIGVTTLGISPVEYFQQTRAALTLNACAQGLIKSGVYGMLVALAGCLRGMQCGRSAAAVGQATTSAVVTSIVCIILASAILTVIWSQLLAAVQAQADAHGQLHWDVHFIDGTMIRAHQHAAGAKKGTQSPKPSAAAGAGSVPKSTCEPKGVAS